MTFFRGLLGPSSPELIESLLQRPYQGTLEFQKWLYDLLARHGKKDRSVDGGLGEIFTDNTHQMIKDAFVINTVDKTVKLREGAFEKLYHLAQAFKSGRISGIKQNDNKYAVCLAILYHYSCDGSAIRDTAPKEKDYAKLALSELERLYTENILFKDKKIAAAADVKDAKDDPEKGTMRALIKVKLQKHEEFLLRNKEQKSSVSPPVSATPISPSPSAQPIVSLPNPNPGNTNPVPSGNGVPSSSSSPLLSQPSLNPPSRHDVEMGPIGSSIPPSGYAGDAKHSSPPQKQKPAEKIAAFLTVVAEKGAGLNLEHKKLFQCDYFLEEIKSLNEDQTNQFNLDDLCCLSNHMYAVQEKKLIDHRFDAVREEQIFFGHGKTTTWQIMGNAVHQEILNQLDARNLSLSNSELHKYSAVMKQSWGRIAIGETPSYKALEKLWHKLNQKELNQQTSKTSLSVS